MIDHHKPMFPGIGPDTAFRASQCADQRSPSGGIDSHHTIFFGCFDRGGSLSKNWSEVQQNSRGFSNTLEPQSVEGIEKLQSAGRRLQQLPMIGPVAPFHPVSRFDPWIGRTELRQNLSSRPESYPHTIMIIGNGPDRVANRNRIENPYIESINAQPCPVEVENDLAIRLEHADFRADNHECRCLFKFARSLSWSAE